MTYHDYFIIQDEQRKYQKIPKKHLIEEKMNFQSQYDFYDL